MRRYVLLSHAIGEGTPLYPGTPPVGIRAVKRIKGGDSCNTLLFSISNHCGTHMDAPRHFSEKGASVGDYPFDRLVFKNPAIADCPKKADEAIGIDDIKDIDPARAPDIILLKTGFSRYRNAEKDSYCGRNPYLSPEAAEWMRINLPSLKAVGIDCISVSSANHRAEGRRAHAILLDERRREGQAVIIVEDMFIPPDIKRLKEVMVLPMLGGDADGSPCAVVGVEGD